MTVVVKQTGIDRRVFSVIFEISLNKSGRAKTIYYDREVTARVNNTAQVQAQFLVCTEF